MVNVDFGRINYKNILVMWNSKIFFVKNEVLILFWGIINDIIFNRICLVFICLKSVVVFYVLSG